MKLRRFLIIAVLGAFTFTSCQDDRRQQEDREALEREEMETEREADMRANEDRMDENTIAARIQDNDDLNTFSENMDRYQIAENLPGDEDPFREGQEATRDQTTDRDQTMDEDQAIDQEGYTVFAPSDDAYEALPEDQRNELEDTENGERNAAYLSYLIIEEELTENELRQEIQNANGTYNIRTMQGEEITATLEGDDIVLRDAAGNQARITESDEDARDGVVHVIDRVLMPQDPNRNEAAIGNTQNRTTTTGTN